MTSINKEKQNRLTQKQLKEVLHYDCDTGLFSWIVSKSGINKNSKTAGWERLGYTCITICGKDYRAHRLAWLYVYGEWPSEFIDHINKVRSDNRIANIRLATLKENSKNQSIPRHNTSGIMGVGWRESRNHWYAQIASDGKNIYLGSFNDKFEAICCRMSANNKYGFHENHGR